MLQVVLSYWCGVSCLACSSHHHSEAIDGLTPARFRRLTAEAQERMVIRYDSRPLELQPNDIEWIALEGLQGPTLTVQQRSFRLLRTIADRHVDRKRPGVPDAFALATGARVREYVWPFLIGSDPVARRMAIEILFRLSIATFDDAIWKTFGEMLAHDASVDVRSQLIREMAAFTPTSALLRPAIATALADRSSPVMLSAAAAAVGQAHLQDLLPRVLPLLNEASTPVRLAAVHALSTSGRDAAPYLNELIDRASREETPTVQRALQHAAMSVQAAMTSPQGADKSPLPDARGAVIYERYCSICHGARGEGQGIERAPSLASASFLASADYRFLNYAIRYGRPGTSMAPFHVSMSGPLSDQDVDALVSHIYSLGPASRAGLQLPRSRQSGKGRRGNAKAGASVYRERCSACHGAEGGGATAPSLKSPTFLYTASPEFVEYAIALGRERTAMPRFAGVLTPRQIDDVTAYVLGWRNDWMPQAQAGAVSPLSSVTEGILNAGGPAATLAMLAPLRAERYITADALKRTFDIKARLILIDTRSTSAWVSGHIPGAISLPYYDLEWRLPEIPRDGTWIVAYCDCPTHLSDFVVTVLRSRGFTHTAVLDGGLDTWIARGYPLTAAALHSE